MPSTAITLEPKVRIEPGDVAGEEKVAATMEVCRSQRRDEVANTNASYADSDWTFELANTWGACLQWREVRIRIAGQAVAGEGDRRESAFDFRDGTAGWELVKALDLAAFGRGLAQEAVEMLGAAKPPAGLMPVVTDPGVSGLLAHEVMGHASEGDEIVKKRSFLTDQVGKKVGSSLVSMYDDGTYPAAHGSIPFDAEGTPAHKTKVIDRGIYRGFLHSLETSGVLKARPTGNGRAQDFGRRVWVRMTNTYFGAGRDKKDEIVEETKSGVLKRKWISGMEDPVGGPFQAVTQSGFRIVKGEGGERVRGKTLTGAALSILKSCSRRSKGDVPSAVGAAIAGLRRVPEDPDFSGLPTEAGKGEVRGAWDAATASTDTAGLLEAAKTFTDAVRESKATSVPKAIVRIQEYTFRVANSNGIVANHRGTLVFAYLTAKCGSKGKFGEGILKAMNTSIRPIDFAALGATVARRASENLRARAFKGKLPGVAFLDPLDLGEIFLTTVGSAVNAEDVHKGRSPWAGKVGADVASAGVTVRARPRMQGGLASGVADDEGNATQDRTLLEAGRLKGFFADRKHAALLGVPAGNGYRRAVATVEGAYTRPAETEPSNLIVEPGRKSLEALIAEVDSGVCVEKFAAPEVNPLSGSFAMEVRNATLIKKGELADHVKVALLTGNFYDGLKNVVGVGRDLTPSHAFVTAPGCAYVPPMAFDGFELVGQA